MADTESIMLILQSIRVRPIFGLTLHFVMAYSSHLLLVWVLSLLYGSGQYGKLRLELIFFRGN